MSRQQICFCHEQGAYSHLPEGERLRRQRIGSANRGKTPWNLGKKHSEGARIKVQRCVFIS